MSTGYISTTAAPLCGPVTHISQIKLDTAQYLKHNIIRF